MDGVVFRDAEFHVGRGGAEKVVQRAAKKSGVNRPARCGSTGQLQQRRVVFLPRVLLVAVADEVIGHDAGILHRAQHHMIPVRLLLVGHGIGDRLCRVVIRPLGAGGRDRADPDGRIDRFHQRVVLCEPGAVFDRVVLDLLNIVLPGPIALVADFPIFQAERARPAQAEEIAAVVRRERLRGAEAGPESRGLPIHAVGVDTEQDVSRRARQGGTGVGVGNPRRRLLRSSGAVVDCDKRLQVCTGNELRELVEAGRPGPSGQHAGALIAFIRAPIIHVGFPAAGNTHGSEARRLHEGDRLSRGRRLIPHDGIGAELALVHGSNRMGGVDGQIGGLGAAGDSEGHGGKQTQTPLMAKAKCPTQPRRGKRIHGEGLYRTPN